MLVNTGTNILGIKQVQFEKLEPSRIAEFIPGTNTVYQSEHYGPFDTHSSYYQFGLEGNEISSSVLNTMMQAYLSGPYMSALKVG